MTRSYEKRMVEAIKENIESEFTFDESLDFKEVEPAVWELPKSGKMNVPVRVFATKTMLEQMKKDRTLKQARNVACLPGIVGASMVMPDGHEGYGFPIGGVAAFDPDANGIVSPGGVGYDINCLTKDSKILTEFGAFREIQDFENDFTNYVNTNGFDISLNTKIQKVTSLTNGNVTAMRLLAFMKKKADNKILSITTKTGFQLVCSEDHPIKTSNGFIKAGLLQNSEKLAVSYFAGVPYERIENEEKTAILAKVLGYFIGDGTLYTSNGKMRACAYGKKEDLEKLKSDIERLGFNVGILERTRNHQINTLYGTNKFTSTCAEIHIPAKEFCNLLLSAGMPLGKKTNREFVVPEWIINSPLWIQRLFLAGFFGAELTKPKTITKTGFGMPFIGMNKNTLVKESGRLFLIQLMQLLENFEVKCNKITERKEIDNKNGPVTMLRLFISADEDNLLNLWRRIGFEYNEKRRKLAEIACQYITLKKTQNRHRIVASAKTKELKSKGLTLKEVQNLLVSSEINARFIERHYYENAGQRIMLNFDSFNDFCEKKQQELVENGTLLDEIVSIKEEKYDDYVYDFTVEQTHNFIANGIVVSNCGVRMLRTDLTYDEVKPKVKELLEALYKNVPCGVGSKGRIRLKDQELEDAVTTGPKYFIDQGLGVKEDLEHCEENGFMKNADFSKVSEMARKRGGPQFGTLGSGNHFLELQKVDEIYDKETAKAFGITKKGQVTIMIHSGSRGFGHQICSDYVRDFVDAVKKYKIELPDRNLVCAPLGTKEADAYFGAMNCAINFAFSNRHIMAQWTRETFSEIFKREWESDLNMKTVYDVCHNIAKFEEHEVNGKKKELCMHRKGATRALWPGRKEVPKAYAKVGQPVVIPGSMSTASYVLVGTKSGMVSMGSSNHGAGRVMSRAEAIRTFKGEQLVADMAKRGIGIKAPNMKSIAEEAGAAYKDVDQVIESVKQSGISKPVCRLTPIGVVKG